MVIWIILGWQNREEIRVLFLGWGRNSDFNQDICSCRLVQQTLRNHKSISGHCYCSTYVRSTSPLLRSVPLNVLK
jgi:ferredoxin-thioredoxin reductase catalytic subunit